MLSCVLSVALSQSTVANMAIHNANCAKYIDRFTKNHTLDEIILEKERKRKRRGTENLHSNGPRMEKGFLSDARCFLFQRLNEEIRPDSAVI